MGFSSYQAGVMNIKSKEIQFEWGMPPLGWNNNQIIFQRWRKHFGRPGGLRQNTKVGASGILSLVKDTSQELSEEGRHINVRVCNQEMLSWMWIKRVYNKGSITSKVRGLSGSSSVHVSLFKVSQDFWPLLKCCCVLFPMSFQVLSLRCVCLALLPNVSHLYQILYLFHVYFNPVFISTCARFFLSP